MNIKIEKLVDRFGKEKVIHAFEMLGLIKGGEVSAFGTCDPGYYWSETLKRCVLDVGGGDDEDHPAPEGE